MEINSIARTVNYYSVNLIKPEIVEALIYPIQFEFLTSGYYKHDFMIYNYKKEGCYLTHYGGLDLDDKTQISLMVFISFFIKNSFKFQANLLPYSIGL